jgi:hypothetical protein
MNLPPQRASPSSKPCPSATDSVRGGMDRDRVWLILGLLFVFALLVRLACFTGLIGSDDLSYSFYAQLVRLGKYDLTTNVVALRVGLNALVGLTYRIFGVGEWSTVAVPLLASAASAPLLYALGRRLMSSRAALLAAILLATFPVHVRYGSTLVPEPCMECLILIAMILFIDADAKDSPRLAVLAGLVLAMG